MAKCELQASEGAHLECEDHLEQVKSELWSEEVGLGCVQNGAKSECLAVPLHLAPTPLECRHGSLSSGTASEGGLQHLRLLVHTPTLAPHETASSSWATRQPWPCPFCHLPSVSKRTVEDNRIRQGYITSTRQYSRDEKALSKAKSDMSLNHDL